MKILSNDLKRMLSALAYQDADDYLTMHEKLNVLGYDRDENKIPDVQGSRAKQPETKRIAFISGGRGSGAPLDYVIDSCLRQHANVDLLLHGAVNMKKVTVMEKQMKLAGINCQRIQLGENLDVDIIDYIHQQPALIFMVAMPDDTAARLLIDEVIPKRGGRISVPLVLIEEKAKTRKHQYPVSDELPSYGT